MTSDPLLNCLVFLTRFYKRPYSAEALQAGLPKSADKFTHALFIRAAERVGLTSRLVKRPLNKLSTFLLPAVVFLNDESCC
ncbi:MAG TPA: type I secretion system permease/ATPase, partial [Methylococcaceae bacterium]|nr:type I secretion system permease/ATPase [Methylococcaceae bacterium]